MNGITYINRESVSGRMTTKSFELLIPERVGRIICGDELNFNEGQAVIIPPLQSFEIAFEGIRIVFENAMLGADKIDVIFDDERAIAFNGNLALRYYNSSILKKDLLISSVSNLLVSLITAFTARSQFSPTVKSVIAQIRKGVSDCSFSVSDCLKKLPLNYDYIRKLFKKETGATPAEYLLKERMELARQLISSGISNKFSRYTMSQIAEACGYLEQLYFSRVFKKYFGVSPTEYKN